MSFSESYFFLFFDSFMSSLIFVPNTHMVFNIMKIVGTYNKYWMFFVAIFGDLTGSSCNYVLGKIFKYVKHNVADSGDSKKLKSLQVLANSKLFILVIFSFIPLVGVLLTSLCGFLKVSYWRFSLAVVFGRVLYYLIQIN